MMFAVMTSYTAHGRVAHREVQGRLPRAPRAHRTVHDRRLHEPHGRGDVVILVLSAVTVLDRIYMTWRELKAGRSLEAVKAGIAAAAIPPTQPAPSSAPSPCRHDHLARPVLDLRPGSWQYDVMVIVILAFIWLTSPPGSATRWRCRAGTHSVALQVEARSQKRSLAFVRNQKGPLTILRSKRETNRTGRSASGFWLLALVLASSYTSCSHRAPEVEGPGVVNLVRAIRSRRPGGRAEVLERHRQPAGLLRRGGHEHGRPS